jgi:hypothetical protein
MRPDHLRRPIMAVREATLSVEGKAMKRWTWGLFLWPVSLLAGCGAATALPPAPVPPVDAAAPARTETATLALG